MIPLSIDDLKDLHQTTLASISKMSPAIIDRWLAPQKTKAF